MGADDFLKLGLNILELTACITGFLYWNKIKGTYWKWFPVYLAVVVLTEFTGKIIIEIYGETSKAGSAVNASLYRYFGIPIQFLFFFWLFWKYFSIQRNYKWPLLGAVIYILSWVTDMMFLTKVKTGFMSFSYTIGNIVLLTLIILFFIRFVNSNAILKYKQSMMFWVSFGLMAFYLVTFPFYALRNTLWEHNKSVFYVYSYVSLGLDYLMYLFFTIAFIWGRPK